MYSKMYKEGKEDSSAFEKMKQLMSLVNFVYCIVLMIVLTYATPTAGFLLQFLVGNKWMSDVFLSPSYPLQGFCNRCCHEPMLQHARWSFWAS